MKKTIVINENIINYSIFFKNKKNISIKIDYNGEVIVCAPINISINYIESLLIEKQEWILTNSKRVKNNFSNCDNKIIFLGKDFPLKIEKSNNEIIYMDSGFVIIKTNNSNIEYIQMILSNWYKEQANIIINKRVKELSNKYSLFPAKIIIRNQKTIWGSCNTKKEIRLNWRLILMPQYVMDYILIHELCHLKHMNHSRQFWNLVESYNKDYKESEKWLKENGIKIMRIN